MLKICPISSNKINIIIIIIIIIIIVSLILQRILSLI